MREQVRATAYRWLTPVWPMTAVGLLVGGIAGGLAAPFVDGTAPTATALIRIDQPIDANQIVTNSVPSPETQQAYLAGEIVYLSSSGFANAVGNELKLPTPPSLLAAQQGQSALVRITATEPTTDEARAALDVALKVYAGRVQQLASDRTGAAIDAITAVIVRVRAETAADAERNDEVVNQLALDDKLRTLEQQRLSLQSQLLRAPGIQVVEPITAESAQSDPSLPIVGGTMLGGLLALAGSLAWRRRTGVIASASQLDRQVTPVLLPVVRLGKRAGTYARSELSRARTLYGQLPAPRTGEILVVGASAYSGTDVVAKLLYMGAVEHVSVSAVNVVGEFANLSSAAVRAKLDALPTDDGQTVIIDGGSVATAPQMLAVAERAGQIVVVVRIGRDVAADVEVLLHAIRNEDVPVTAICTKGRLATADGLLSGRRGRSEGGRHSLGSRPPVAQALPAAPLPPVYEPPLPAAPPPSAYEPSPTAPVPQPVQQPWSAEQFDGPALPAERMLGHVGAQPEVDTTVLNDEPTYTMSEILLEQVPAPTEVDQAGDAPSPATWQEAPVDESDALHVQGEQQEPHLETDETASDTTPEQIHTPTQDEEHPTEQHDPLSPAWHVPTDDDNDDAATQHKEQESDAEQRDDAHSDNGHHPPAAATTDLAAQDEQSEHHVEQFEVADNTNGLSAEDEQHPEQHDAEHQSAADGNDDPTAQNEHAEHAEHVEHSEHHDEQRANSEDTDGDQPDGFADTGRESPANEINLAPAHDEQPEYQGGQQDSPVVVEHRPTTDQDDQLEHNTVPTDAPSDTAPEESPTDEGQPQAGVDEQPEPRDTNVGIGSEPSRGDNLHPRPWFSGLRRRPDQVEQRSAPSFAIPAPPVEVSPAPVLEDQQHPEHPEAASDSEPESPADEVDHQRPWISLLRRKAAQDEQDTSANGQQPPTDDNGHAPTEHHQDHTHAQNH